MKGSRETVIEKILRGQAEDFLRRLTEEIIEETTVVDTEKNGEPTKWFRALSTAAKGVTPGDKAYPSAQRLLKAIGENVSPAEIDLADVEEVFRATNRWVLG